MSGWRPEPGDTVAGEVVDADRIEGTYEPYIVLSIATIGGEVTEVHCFHQTLARQLKKHSVQVGDRISITYVGRAGDDPKDAYIYRVVGGRPPVIDWDSADVGTGGGSVDTTVAIESDVPFDTTGLPKPIEQRARETYGDAPAY